MTAATLEQRIILCEGYDDRAFWAGWLLRPGCRDLAQSEGGRRITPTDPWGRPVRGDGKFAFAGRNGGFLCIQPYGGVIKLETPMDIIRRQHDTRPVAHLLINTDCDDDAEHSTATARDRIATVVRRVFPDSQRTGNDEYQAGSMRISAVI